MTTPNRYDFHGDVVSLSGPDLSGLYRVLYNEKTLAMGIHYNYRQSSRGDVVSLSGFLTEKAVPRTEQLKSATCN